MDPDKIAGLQAYFGEIWPNPTGAYNPGLDFPGSLHRLQSRWLGMGCEIRMALAIPNLESSHELQKKRQALEVLMKIKGLALPDEQAWFHPVMPDGWREDYEALMEAKKSEPKIEMRKENKPEKKKSTRKLPTIKPRKVRVKK